MKAILERELKVEMHILGANTLILFHWLVMNIYTTVCISYLVKKRKRKIQWQVKRVWFWCESYQSGNHGSAPKMLDQSVTNFTPWWLSSLESSFFMSPRKLEDGICQPSPAWEGEDSKKLLWTPFVKLSATCKAEDGGLLLCAPWDKRLPKKEAKSGHRTTGIRGNPPNQRHWSPKFASPRYAGEGFGYRRTRWAALRWVIVGEAMNWLSCCVAKQMSGRVELMYRRRPTSR